MRNEWHKKLKKIQAVNLNPENLFYDLLSAFTNKSKLGQKMVKNQWPNLSNKKIDNAITKVAPLEQFTLNADSIFNNNQLVKQCLVEYGVCVLTDLVERERALNAFNQIKSFLTDNGFINENGVRSGNGDNFGETPEFYWQADLAKFKLYTEAATANKPVVNIRSKKENTVDSGMIDIFGVEKLIDVFNMDALGYCYDVIKNEKIDSLLENVSGYKATQANLYFNAGVTHTRGPHIDNNSESYKLFIYLSDVLNPDDGPYCYVPGSHKKRNWMSKERLINSINHLPSTEVSSMPKERTTQLFGKAGTAIITCQSGLHCGWPQSETGQRAVLIGNYN